MTEKLAPQATSMAGTPSAARSMLRRWLTVSVIAASTSLHRWRVRSAGRSRRAKPAHASPASRQVAAGQVRTPIGIVGPAGPPLPPCSVQAATLGHPLQEDCDLLWPASQPYTLPLHMRVGVQRPLARRY